MVFARANACFEKGLHLAFAAVRSTKTVQLNHAAWANAPSPAASALTILSVEASAVWTLMAWVPA